MRLFTKIKESSTLQVLLVPLCLIWYKYWDGSITDVVDFVTANATLLAVWLGREWKESHYADKD